MNNVIPTIRACPIMSVVFLVSLAIAGGRLAFGLTTGLELPAGFGVGTPWFTAWAALFGASLHLYNHWSDRKKQRLTHRAKRNPE